jgi:hypothetical protein
MKVVRLASIFEEFPKHVISIFVCFEKNANESCNFKGNALETQVV